MYKKLIVASSYLIIGLLIYLYGESLLDWIRHGGNDYVVMTTVIATLMALFPIIPYPIIGGVIGAAYGPALGALVTWIGSSLASIIMFIVVRYGYHDWGIKVLRSYKPLERITILFEKNAFLTIFITRLIPIIPSIIVNIYSALSRVTFISYAVASSLGKVPSMFLFAFVGNTLLTNPSDIFATIAVYSSFLGIVFVCYRLWKKRTDAKIGLS
ncbi:TVP38/TMEM64 family protein [Desertibacillus haloalkaliphilus]|uniref:TVP38/TMEM64 family protein n=1 Tax=Desertibacillus haloalkaliphilus TaxID=1328930 RepID=UPI001C259EBE|nr:TVP38/TMEM64 family protein [Desertibacillus haloalkaliphilus]MBU8907429.1 TVP38/TMEM64 family protein [Desertibacillus haloalkaliphilus]